MSQRLLKSGKTVSQPSRGDWTPSFLSSVACSMTELEKDIGSLKSGLKCVEAVSESSCVYRYSQGLFKETCFCVGAALPAGPVPSGSRGQVCLRGQTVPDGGLLQLLGR